MVLFGSLGCTIMAPKYALCKHGTSHSRRSCGFAHSLAELELADQPLCYGIDSSSAPYGRSGVDLFYGQSYSASQLLRVLMYVTQASQLPLWGRMVLWYYRILPISAFALDFDFSWPSSVSQVADLCLHTDVSSEDARGLCDYAWPEAYLAADFCARMIARLESEQVLPVLNLRDLRSQVFHPHALLHFRGRSPGNWYVVPCEELGDSEAAFQFDPRYEISYGDPIYVHQLGGPRGFGHQLWPLPHFVGQGVVYMAWSEDVTSAAWIHAGEGVGGYFHVPDPDCIRLHGGGAAVSAEEHRRCYLRAGLVAALACAAGAPGDRIVLVTRQGIATDAENDISAFSVLGDPLLEMGCRLVHELSERGPYDRITVSNPHDVGRQHEAGLRMCEAVCATAVSEGVLELGHLSAQMLKFFDPVRRKRRRSSD